MNHPGKQATIHELKEPSWGDRLKLSQIKFLTENATESVREEADAAQNLTISNKLKGIMNVHLKDGKLSVIENIWRLTTQKFQGAFVAKKFGK